jgi:hypothetical protein
MANRRCVRAGLRVTLSLLFVFATAAPSWATGNIVKSDLKGTWRISLRGVTDCGFSSMLATITFGTNGVGTGPLQIHGDCGDSTLAGQTFTVETLTKAGEGTASLTCGGGCEFNFNMQVAPNRAIFNLVDVNPLETTHFLDGLAVLSSPADNIVTADLKGDWTFALMGNQLSACSGPETWTVSALATTSLDTAGAGDLSVTLHTRDGDFTGENPFSILGLNPDGSGTALIECDPGLGFTFSIQVSPDRSMFNLVTVSASDPGDFLAGVAMRRSTAGNITKTNSAGPWQATGLSQEGDDGPPLAILMTFKMNAKALAGSTTFTFHSDGFDGTLVGGGQKIETLNPDGSGTACSLDEAGDCEEYSRIQVSPDRSIVIGVAVDPGSDPSLFVSIHQ